MKAFAYILSLYMLVLTAISCIDVPKENALYKAEFYQNTPNSHQNNADHCSPSCTCQCCQKNFFVSIIISIYAFNELEVRYNEFFPRFNSLEFFDFLIPPRS